ncbi:MAG: ATP-binding protein [Planktotalea arctica]
MIDPNEIIDLLRVKGKHLFHREGQSLEFKEQFNFAALADYFRDFSAFANNKGGCLIFGVTDAPRTASGLSERSLAAFSKLDPEMISGFILEIFSCNIFWESLILEHEEKHFAVFKVYEAVVKPVIAKKDEGRGQAIRNGDIYYRYGGRTQRIQSAELERIINKHIENAHKDWIRLVKDIGPAGPRNAFILKTDGKPQANGSFVVDGELAKKLKFLKEGHFDEVDGGEALKLVGSLEPVDTLEVEKVVKENLFERYPYSATELANEVRKQLPSVGANLIWDTIKENGLKGSDAYGAYNFRNMKQQDEFEECGKVALGTPSIYSKDALSFLLKILR